MGSDDTITYAAGADPDETATGTDPAETAPSATHPAETHAAGAREPLAGEGAERLRGVVFANRFEVVKLLGEGGMGQVFRVHDRQIEGREIALKILHPRFSDDPRFRGLFFQEVRAGQSFVSEHVVQVRDTGQMEDGRLFLTMDLVEGENLSALLKREHSLDARHALEITRQALLGLKSGHEKGFIHRDIKPSNLMLRARTPKTEKNPFGVHVLILDFGLANLARELKTGQVAGTPYYMSPEQVRDERLDARSDLFAAAVVLYEMISGSRPFQGKTMHEVTSSVIETDVVPMIASLEHLSPAIRKILERALQKDREQRFQSAGEFIEAIERSKAYRLPTRVAPWLLTVTVGGTVAAGVEAMLLWQREKEVDRLHADSFHLKDVISQKEVQIQEIDRGRVQLESEHTARLAEKDKLLEQKQALLNQAAADYENNKAGLESQLQELRNKYSAAVAELESLRKKDASSGTQSLDLQSQIDRLEALRQESESRAADSQRQVATLAEDLREQEREVARLREENNKLRLKAEPEAQRAAGFDVLLRLVEEGRGVAAWQKYLDLEKETLAKGDSHGGDFVEALARAARELALFDDPAEGERSGEARHLIEAGRALTEAEKHLPVLPTAAADWITHHLAGREGPDRMAAARAALQRLRDGLAGRQGRISGVHESAAAELLALSPRSGPEALLQHLARFGCDHGPPALARAAADFAAEVVDAGGRIDARKLRAAETLEAWGAALADGRLPVDSGEARTLLALWLARGWYAAGELRGTAELHARVLGALDAERGAGDLWRGILALQLAFARQVRAAPKELPTHGSTGFALFRKHESGGTAWVKERVESPDGEGWTLAKEVLALDPLKPSTTSTQPVTQPGPFHFDFRGWTLDLASAGAEVGLERWQVPSEALPAGLDHALDGRRLAAFQAAEAGSAHPCLVIEGERGLRRWFSPRFGLVRVDQAGTVINELVYTDTRRN